jgi:hypothetical protein
VYLSGTTLWLGAAAANAPFTLELTALGRNGVDTATWEGKSGSLSSSPASDTTASSSPFASGAYTWDGTAPLNDSIHVTRDPGATVDSVSVVSDVAGPTGSISYPNSTILSHSVPVTTSASDAGSGVSTVAVERSETPLTGSTCGTTWTAFAPVSLSGGSDTTVADATCYRYRAVVTDHVGNSAVFSSANVVQIPDITPPAFVSAATNAAGTKLTITMSETLDPGASTRPDAFGVEYDGVAQPTPTAVAVSGSTVELDLVSPPNNSETVRVRYSQPSSAAERLRDQATPTANDVASFGPEPVVNNTPDTVAPQVVSASANGDRVTIVFDEALAGATPDASAFTMTAGSTTRAITTVAMGGSSVTLTVSPALTSTDTVAVTYAIPATNGLHDAAANAVAPFTRVAGNQTPPAAPPAVAPPSETPGPQLVSESPADGTTVGDATTITLTANQRASWTAMTLTRPDGTTAALAGGDGDTWTWPLAQAGSGLYVVRGTLSADGKTADVLTHFTIWSAGDGSVPPVEKNAVPFAGGELPSSDGRAMLTWPAGAFADAVVVEVAPTVPDAVSGLPAGAVVVNVNAYTRSTRARVHDLGGVADIRFSDSSPGSRVVTSQDGASWRDIPQLPTLSLPEGQADGWFLDSDQTVHVLTRHLTYYAVVGPQVSTKLAIRIVTVRRLWLAHHSFVGVRLSLTGPARVTGSFVAAGGSVVPVTTISTRIRRAGVTILRVPLAGTRPGLYRLQLRAEGLGQSVGRTAKIRLLSTKPASPVWQDGAVRVAVVRGVHGLDSLGSRLGRRYVVRTVDDADLYRAVDTNYRTAAAVVVVDLATVPAYTIAELHALLPEVQIIGIAGGDRGTAAYRNAGVSAMLPRTAPPARVAATIRRLVGR